MHIRYGNKVSILSVDEPLGNCHAYTFTRDKGGRLSGDDVAVILADNGYKLIAIANEISEAPQKEDVVIYHVEDPQDSTQYITHSGVFSRTEGEEFYVASKAGPYDITEHLISYNKYYGEWTIYHTDRPNGRFIDSNSISELVGLL